MAKVIWTKQALNDFESLLDYISTDAPIAACRFGEKVIDRIEALEHDPLVGGFVQEDDTRRYRQILQGNYRIIYRVEGDVVYVVAVYHAARLLDSESLD